MSEGFYLYILRCSDGTYYTGHTDDLEKRLGEHHAGKFQGYTSVRRPLTLVYSELFHTRDEAWAAEQKIGRWSRKKKEILIFRGWEGFLKK